jgi:hypothetical protein
MRIGIRGRTRRASQVDGVGYFKYAEQPTFDTFRIVSGIGVGPSWEVQNLETIGFWCINHSIGRLELDWMAKSWPRLKLMYDLDKERLYLIEHDKERAALKEYLLQLRPHVVHDGLFEDSI